MKILLACALVLCAGTVSAHTLSWDRNGDATVDYYSVYACYTAGCTPTLTEKIAAVDQSADGVRPQYVLDLAGKTGTFTVTATSGDAHESPFSLPLAFTYPVPTQPDNLTAKTLNTDQIEITGLNCTALKTSGRGLRRVVICVH